MHSRSFYNRDYDSMRADLEEIDWESEFLNLNTQQRWDKFYNKINGLIQRHVPKKKFTTSRKYPWYGREINTLSREKKRAWNKYQKSSNSENWSNYTSARNELTHTIETRKKEYENKIASEIK